MFVLLFVTILIFFFVLNFFAVFNETAEEAAERHVFFMLHPETQRDIDPTRELAATYAARAGLTIEDAQAQTDALGDMEKGEYERFAYPELADAKDKRAAWEARFGSPSAMSDALAAAERKKEFYERGRARRHHPPTTFS